MAPQQCANEYYILLMLAFVIKGIHSCTETNINLRPIDCVPLTDTEYIPYTNTTIAQKIQFCDINNYRKYDSLRIMLNPNASQRTSTIEFEFTFGIYKYNEWKAANCDKHMHEICTTATPIKQLPNIKPAISSFTSQQLPQISINFDNYFLLNASDSYTSYIWQLHVINGFDITNQPDVNFVTCENDSNNDTSYVYQLIQSCSTNNDNSLTELDPYYTCNYDSSTPPDMPGFDQLTTALSFKANYDRIFQYFAVTESTFITGVNVYLQAVRFPTMSPTVTCSFTATLHLYQYPFVSAIRTSDPVYIVGLNDKAVITPFLFTELEINTDTNKYFYFELVATNGISPTCGIKALACFDQSNMKTWLTEAYDPQVEKCYDFYYDEKTNNFYKNVDIAFTLIQHTTKPTSTILDTIATEYYTTAMDITTTKLMNDGTNVVEFEESDALTVTIAILGTFGIITLLLAFMCSCITPCDNFVYSSVVIFVVHSIDVFSDVFFSISIWTDHALIKGDSVFLILAICSLVFIILPMLKNFYDLIRFQKETQNDMLHGDRYRLWLNSYGTSLLILALISGSTFGTMKLMNSNLFGMRMFSMGLCMSHLQKYHSYRVVNVVLMENLPQLIIQIVFSASIPGKVPLISILSAITSILSIIVSTLDHLSKRELTKQAASSLLFTFKITSQTISKKPKQYKNRQKVIRKAVSKILILDEMAVEIVHVEEYSDKQSDGLIIYLLITTLKYISTHINDTLLQSFQNGLMDKQMKRAWNMKEKPYCSNLQWIHTNNITSSNQLNVNSMTYTTVTVKEGDGSKAMDVSHLKSTDKNISELNKNDEDDDMLIVATPIAHKQIAANITPYLNMDDSTSNNNVFPDTFEIENSDEKILEIELNHVMNEED